MTADAIAYAALSVSLAGHAAAAHGKRWGWALRHGAGFGWLLYGMISKQIPIVVTSLAYMSLDMYGFLRKSQ